ncbi:MAG: calcium/proton exchanger [Actinomycetota bacterium]
MPKPRLSWLLVLLPVPPIAEFALDQHSVTFVTAAIVIIPLAGLIGRSTDQLAIHAGPRIGGLLNATFGNVTELILSIFLILQGDLEIVKASLIGSIIGNLLLVLGLSLLVGGLRHTEQEFSVGAAGVHSSSLILAVTGLVMPAVFVLSAGHQPFVQREVVSVTVALVLMALYAAALLFMFVTHEHLFRTPESDEHAEWSVRRATGILLGSTAVVAVMADLLVRALEPTVEDLGMSKLFVGLVLIPIIGNAAEHGSAVLMAVRNKVDATLEIAIGSSVQIALFVAPALVLISLATSHRMDFVFDTFEVVAVALATVIVSVISQDGKSNWLEGAQLVGAYVIMAISFLFVQGG